MDSVEAEITWGRAYSIQEHKGKKITKNIFDKMNWQKGMKAKIIKTGEVGLIVSVDFDERLIGLVDATSKEVIWYRCESLELIKE